MFPTFPACFLEVLLQPNPKKVMKFKCLFFFAIFALFLNRFVLGSISTADIEHFPPFQKDTLFNFHKPSKN